MSQFRVNIPVQRIVETITKNVHDLVGTGGLMMENELKLELSHPGSGRFYARRDEARAISTRPFDELTRPQVISLITPKLDQKVRFEGRRILGIRDAIGVHQASAPGEPPAPDSGHLRASIQSDTTDLRDPVRPRVRVGSGGETGRYGRELEYGNMNRRLSKRPWMRPTIARMRPKIRAIFTVQNVLKGLI